MALINTYTPFNFVENKYVRQVFKSIMPTNLKFLKRKTITIKSGKIYNSVHQWFQFLED